MYLHGPLLLRVGVQNEVPGCNLIMNYIASPGFTVQRYFQIIQFIVVSCYFPFAWTFKQCVDILSFEVMFKCQPQALQTKNRYGFYDC